MTLGRRKSARAALIELDQPATDVLTDCFQQFGIDAIPLRRGEIERMHLDPYDACVLNLDEGAACILEVARSCPRNFQMMIFGLAASGQQALQYSRYGINAVLEEPLKRDAVLRTLRNTHLFMVREVRRYIRVPLVTPVNLLAEGQKLTALAAEISAGGMSLCLDMKLPVALHVELEFALPNAGQVRIPASVRWLHHGQIGLRFDEDHLSRRFIRLWIDKYLGIT